MLNRMRNHFRDFLRNRRNFNPTRIVAGSFGVIILLGTLLLMLPAASRDGQSAGLFASLFTATSASCVTGLIVADTWLQWSLFGQTVILVMIQLGGLGFMTVITLFSLALHRRIGLSERLVMVSTLNLNDMDGVVRMVQHALMGTFCMEGRGRCCCPCASFQSSVLRAACGGASFTVSPPFATRALTCWAATAEPFPAWPASTTIRWCC